MHQLHKAKFYPWERHTGQFLFWKCFHSFGVDHSSITIDILCVKFNMRRRNKWGIIIQKIHTLYLSLQSSGRLLMHVLGIFRDATLVHKNFIVVEAKFLNASHNRQQSTIISLSVGIPQIGTHKPELKMTGDAINQMTNRISYHILKCFPNHQKLRSLHGLFVKCFIVLYMVILIMSFGTHCNSQ